MVRRRRSLELYETSPAGDVRGLAPRVPFSIRSTPGLVVLVDQCDPVALADAVVDAGNRDFEVAEFAAL